MTPDLSKWSVKIVAKKILYLSFACQVLFPIYYHANLVTERNIICLQKETLCENCEHFKPAWPTMLPFLSRFLPLVLVTTRTNVFIRLSLTMPNIYRICSTKTLMCCWRGPKSHMHLQKKLLKYVSKLSRLSFTLTFQRYAKFDPLCKKVQIFGGKRYFPGLMLRPKTSKAHNFQTEWGTSYPLWFVYRLHSCPCEITASSTNCKFGSIHGCHFVARVLQSSNKQPFEL